MSLLGGLLPDLRADWSVVLCLLLHAATADGDFSSAESTQWVIHSPLNMLRKKSVE